VSFKRMSFFYSSSSSRLSVYTRIDIGVRVLHMTVASADGCRRLKMSIVVTRPDHAALPWLVSSMVEFRWVRVCSVAFVGIGIEHLIGPDEYGRTTVLLRIGNGVVGDGRRIGHALIVVLGVRRRMAAEMLTK
jgi:hypothetical protein